MPFKTHEEYMASIDPEPRKRLHDIQAEVERLLPQAVRCVSYNIPAFKDKRVFFYFAAFKKHIGIYPPVRDDLALIAATKPYRGPKGNLCFAHAKPLPLELIGRVAVALAAQEASK
jgi:uncharacterized protein YdhG (YjbR/CyaY superfamily)